MNRGISVVSLSVDRLLGHTYGQSLGDALATASPKEPATVAAVVRTHLHTATAIGDDLIRQVAADLALPPRQLADLLHTPRPLLLNPTARALIAGLRDACPDIRVVVCSNLAAADHTHANAVRDELGQLLDAAYFSCETGLAKGTGPPVFEHLARSHGVEVAEIVHVGDTLLEDVQAPLLAGARALWVHPDHARIPRVAGPDRYRAVPDLAEAICELREWMPESQPRPALPVRAAALIRDAQQRILLVRGPDDEDFSLPGGRCEAIGSDSPPTAMAREVHEELRLAVTPGKLVWAGWSEAESATGDNKIHFVFEAHIVGTSVPVPDAGEVAEICWSGHHEALRLLHPAEADRLHRIGCDRSHGWQYDTTRPLRAQGP
ncbi:NUDIX domain-containing protein [Saccharopolyspora sp. SCSIO 74807]|uniref:NUDIX domain-containing protein n=1 Tax=Saccharopolyspora sp. SCSIO 74807 TaxID=3118084 RepID=UPI0030CEDC86